MAEELTVLDGNTFFVSDRAGDVEAGETANGFFHADMRHLSNWQLLVDGRPVHVLTSRTVDYYSASVFGTLASVSVGENPPISIRRDRFIASGVHEDITVQNHSGRPQTVMIEVQYRADFADLFEVKDRKPKRGQLRTELGENAATLIYSRDAFRRDTVVGFSEEFQVGERSARVELHLSPRGTWQTCIDVVPVADGTENRLHHGERTFGNPKPNMPTTFEQWMAQAPTLETDNDVLRHTYRQSLIDLAALRFRPLKDLSFSLPAAGLPWFMALFGRDSLITAYQALPFQPHLARTSLEALTALQATGFDDFRDAEPGKILHELRRGELTMLGERPHSPYYGTHDATPLFLILLDEYERWSGERDFVRKLRPAAMKALDWLERRASAVVRYRPERSRHLTGKASDVARDVHRLGNPDDVRQGRRLQPDRVPQRHHLASRHCLHRRGDAPLRPPRAGVPPGADGDPGGGGVRVSSAGSLRGVSAGRDRRTGRLPDRLPTPGVGGRRAVARPAHCARSRCRRWETPDRSSPQRGLGPGPAGEYPDRDARTGCPEPLMSLRG